MALRFEVIDGFRLLERHVPVFRIGEILSRVVRLQLVCQPSAAVVATIEPCSVLVTRDSGSEYVYAANTEESEGSGTREYLIVSGENGGEPVRVTEICPKVRGVAVVCTNGDRADVKEKITTLLSAALGIPTNRIRVSS